MNNGAKDYEKPLLAKLGNIAELTHVDPSYQSSAAGGLPPGGGPGTNI